MDQLSNAQNLSDAVLKLRLEMISQLARGKKEKSKEFKPLNTRKQIEEYRNKILMERIKEAKKTRGGKKYILPEMTLEDDFLEAQPTAPTGLLSDADKQTLRDEISDLSNELSNQEKILRGATIENKNFKYRLDRTTDPTEQANIEFDIDTNNNLLNDTQTEIERLKSEMETRQNRLNTNEQNISNYQAEIDRVNKLNRFNLESYQSLLNNLNVEESKVERLPDETDEEYLQRLKDVGASTYDDDQLELLSEMDAFDTLKQNLTDLFKDKSLIDSVIKQLSTDKRVLLNKSFPAIKERFIKLYGFNNEKLSPEEIVLNLENIYKSIFEPDNQIGQLSTDVSEILKDVKTVLVKKSGDYKETEPPPEEFSFDENGQEIGDLKFTVNEDIRTLKTGRSVDTKVLSIQNMPRGAEIHVKVGPKKPKNAKQPGLAGKYDVFVMRDVLEKKKDVQGDPSEYYSYILPVIGEFNKVEWDSADKNNKYMWSNILKNDLKLTERQYNNNKELYSSIFDYETSIPSKNVLLETLKNSGLLFDTEVQVFKKDGANYKALQTEKKFETAVGMGITTKYDIPTEPVQYGNILLNLHKLYYKNIVSIKDLGNRQIQSFKSTPVSDEFVNYVIKGFYKEPVSETDYKQLKSSELELLDQLNYLAGFAKEKNIKKQKYVDELRQELDLLTGAIVAGNNNEKMLKDLRTILNKLVSFDAISLQSSKNYLNQFKPYFE